MGGFLAWLKSLFAGTPPPVTRIKVKINYDKDGSCWNYDLEADDNGSDPFVKPGNKIVFPNGQPTSTIEFRLQGKAAQKLDFDLAGGPIWVQANSCPTLPSSVPGEITVLSTSTANRLDIQNKNLNAGDLHYRLNFLDDQGNAVHWDPVIRNGGGGGP
jgi:hypothetical protein